MLGSKNKEKRYGYELQNVQNEGRIHLVFAVGVLVTLVATMV